MKSPQWMRKTLKLAAWYNVIWGSFVILFPNFTLSLAGISDLQYVMLWQCIGMIVGVYGIGYWFAAKDPFTHWPIVLVGFLGKLFGPIGIAFYLIQGLIPVEMIGVTLFNDLVWLVPFGLILYAAFEHQQSIHDMMLTDINMADYPDMALYRTQYGQTLQSLTSDQPYLLIFLRHFGCTFCREAMSDLRDQRHAIEESGTGIVLVHMVDDDSADAYLRQYGLDDLPRIANPDTSLYQAFDLKKGSFWQLFGIEVLLRGLRAGFLDGNGIGKLAGDGSQMPGTFLVYNGKILQSFRNENACDRPSYLLMASCCDVSMTG